MSIVNYQGNTEMATVLKKIEIVGQSQVAATGGGTACDIAALIHEIGALLPAAEKAQKQIRMLQAGLKPMQEKLRTLTRLVTADDRHAPDQAFTVVGGEFQAAVGKRIRVRTVRDVKRAIRLLNGVKKGLAYEVVTVPLGKLDGFLTPEQAAEVLESGWGDRSVTVMKKVPLKLAPKKAA